MPGPEDFKMDKKLSDSLEKVNPVMRETLLRHLREAAAHGNLADGTPPEAEPPKLPDGAKDPLAHSSLPLWMKRDAEGREKHHRKTLSEDFE